MDVQLLSADQRIDTQAREQTHWRPLTILNFYRSLIAGIFCILYLSDNLFSPLGSLHEPMFFRVSLVYFLVSLVFWALLLARYIPFKPQVYAATVTDIVFITLVMHTSGGVQSGLGVLLIVSIAGGSIVLGGRAALALAALATIALFLEQFLSFIALTTESNYPQAGLLGITYFATAVLVHALARRIRESEALAQRRGFDLANMAQLTEHIIQRMQTGIVVVDPDGLVRLMNESAWQMLGAPRNVSARSLASICPELQQQLDEWRYDHELAAQKIHIDSAQLDVLPRFARIGEDQYAGALIFLQDMALTAQQAQQLQLASLGRLTASIAHEIRNPLGAISHAGQLLAESTQQDKNDQRLTQIIAEHSTRLNTIVENIMQVSRRKPSQIELFALKDFVQRFIQEYSAGQDVDPAEFDVQFETDDIEVRFDTVHLHQILVNLVDNALRHSPEEAAKPRVQFHAGYLGGSTRPYLDIMDKGPGIDPQVQSHIFEPFYTTEAQGTGLGLYLSRELAEGNQAHLNYINTAEGKGHFRISFQDPRRHIE